MRRPFARIRRLARGRAGGLSVEWVGVLAACALLVLGLIGAAPGWSRGLSDHVTEVVCEVVGTACPAAGDAAADTDTDTDTDDDGAPVQRERPTGDGAGPEGLTAKTFAASGTAPGVGAGPTYEWCVVDSFAPDGTSTGDSCAVFTPAWCDDLNGSAQLCADDTGEVAWCVSPGPLDATPADHRLCRANGIPVAREALHCTTSPAGLIVDPATRRRTCIVGAKNGEPAVTPRILECAAPSVASGERLFEGCALAPAPTATTAACEGDPRTTGPWRVTVVSGLFASKYHDTWVCAFEDHAVRACGLDRFSGAIDPDFGELVATAQPSVDQLDCASPLINKAYLPCTAATATEQPLQPLDALRDLRRCTTAISHTPVLCVDANPGVSGNWASCATYVTPGPAVGDGVAVPRELPAADPGGGDVVDDDLDCSPRTRRLRGASMLPVLVAQCFERPNRAEAGETIGRATAVETGGPGNLIVAARHTAYDGAEPSHVMTAVDIAQESLEVMRCQTGIAGVDGKGRSVRLIYGTSPTVPDAAGIAAHYNPTFDYIAVPRSSSIASIPHEVNHAVTGPFGLKVFSGLTSLLSSNRYEAIALSEGFTQWTEERVTPDLRLDAEWMAYMAGTPKSDSLRFRPRRFGGAPTSAERRYDHWDTTFRDKGGEYAKGYLVIVIAEQLEKLAPSADRFALLPGCTKVDPLQRWIGLSYAELARTGSGVPSFGDWCNAMVATAKPLGVNPRAVYDLFSFGFSVPCAPVPPPDPVPVPKPKPGTCAAPRPGDDPAASCPIP